VSLTVFLRQVQRAIPHMVYVAQWEHVVSLVAPYRAGPASDAMEGARGSGGACRTPHGTFDAGKERDFTNGAAGPAEAGFQAKLCH
jgi:hypothetical protein